MNSQLAKVSVLTLMTSGVSAVAPALGAPPSALRTSGDILHAGFAQCDITPKIGDKPIYMAGFGKNRKAIGVHDPLFVRAIVLTDGKKKLALASVDVVGLFRASVERVRARVPGFSYVLVSSTHNHEGPDTLGLWGPSFIKSGVNPAYLKQVEDGIVSAIGQAESAARAVNVRLGKANGPELLHDGREPYVKHDEIVVLEFQEPKTKRTAGLLVQWNCHPETLGGDYTRLSADFVGATVASLNKKHRAPVVYFTGTVGGLMTSLHVPVKDDKGNSLADGTVDKTERYGRLVADLADRALAVAEPVSLLPMEIRSRPLFLPLDNQLYLYGWRLGVMHRHAYLWTGDSAHAQMAPAKLAARTPLCLRSEIAWLRLGDLEVAAIPGEIYPELVLDRVQAPPDPGADFPKAAIEPAIYRQLRSRHKMLMGLANDEIGYIIPKRQWDDKPPFCYGRKTAQYGEVNSLGPETAPILCKAFQELVHGRSP